jgi:hypothetical protein
MKNLLSELRLALAIRLIKIAIWVINKKTIEGISLVVAIDSWARYLEHSYKEQSSSENKLFKV